MNRGRWSNVGDLVPTLDLGTVSPPATAAGTIDIWPWKQLNPDVVCMDA